MYVMLTKDDNRYCEYLSEALSEKVKSTDDTNVRKYDSLTSAYIRLLDSISDAVKSKSSMIFFRDKYDYSSAGKNFISRTNRYKNAVEQLAADTNLRKRLNLVLNTNDVVIKPNEISDNNENNVRELNTTYVKYIDYYYKGFTPNQCLAFISSKKRSLLEMEMEYILSTD